MTTTIGDPDHVKPEAAQKGTPTVTKEKPLLKETLSGSERTTRGKNKPRGVKDDDVGKTVITPLPDEFLSGKPRGRPLGVKPKNMAKVRFSEPLCEFGPRGKKTSMTNFPLNQVHRGPRLVKIKHIERHRT